MKVGKVEISIRILVRNMLLGFIIAILYFSWFGGKQAEREAAEQAYADVVSERTCVWLEKKRAKEQICVRLEEIKAKERAAEMAAGQAKVDVIMERTRVRLKEIVKERR